MFLLIVFHFLLFPLLVLTFVAFFLLLKGGTVKFFNLFFDCWRGKECGLIFLKTYFHYWGGKGEGLEVSFFLFHLTCGRGKGRGFFLILKTFFHYWMVREVRGQGSFFFSFDLLKGEGKGRCWFFLNFIIGGVGVS